MKVALSVEALTPRLTGIGRYTWELASRLPFQNIESVRYFRHKRWVRDLAELVDPQTLEVRNPRKGLWPHAPYWYRDLHLNRDCADLLFHGPNYFVPNCANLAIATVHDLSVFAFPETHPPARRDHFNQEFHASMARVAHVITDSEATRIEVMTYLQWPGDKVTAVPLGVSPRFKPMPAIEITACLHRYGLTPFQYSLCVSTLEPRKKIDHLLRAYESLPARLRAQFPLVLIGEAGWESEALHFEIDRLARQGWLRYLGFVLEADLPALYSGARSFFYPSIYEGFGLPVLEAMASGVPVVAANRTSLPEITQGCALLVDPEDVTALAEGVLQSLEDDRWRITASRHGARVAKSYSWDRCVSETVAIYEKISAAN